MEEKVAAIIAALRERYPDALCALHYGKDYELMISVRLSAQCTDARVRALRRKAHRDHQLVVLPIVQRAKRVRIPLPQRRNDRRDLFLHADPSVSFAAIIA